MPNATFASRQACFHPFRPPSHVVDAQQGRVGVGRELVVHTWGGRGQRGVQACARVPAVCGAGRGVAWVGAGRGERRLAPSPALIPQAWVGRAPDSLGTAAAATRPHRGAAQLAERQAPPALPLLPDRSAAKAGANHWWPGGPSARGARRWQEGGAVRRPGAGAPGLRSAGDHLPAPHSLLGRGRGAKGHLHLHNGWGEGGVSPALAQVLPGACR